MSHPYFNSIKVQLEQNENRPHNYLKIAFQFHKGTIRTHNPMKNTSLCFLFQFHKGTIRTIRPCGEFIQSM